MKTKYAIIMAGLALLLLLALACTEAGIGGSIGASTAGDIGTDAAQPGGRYTRSGYTGTGTGYARTGCAKSSRCDSGPSGIGYDKFLRIRYLGNR